MTTCTHTKTYTLLDPWASTVPWTCAVDPSSACDCDGGCGLSGHSPMVGDPCALNACAKPLRQDEECYAVTEIDGWVCWRHVRPDEGPIRAERTT